MFRRIVQCRGKVLKGEIYRNERFGFPGPEQVRVREEMKELRDTMDKESHNASTISSTRSTCILY